MQIYILLTENCNLSCKMCIRGKQMGNELPVEDLRDIFSKDVGMRNNDVVVTGGEPTLHPKFVEIVEFLSGFSNSVAITTNGILNYYIDELNSIPNVIVQVSVDGDEYAHDAIRGNGNFNRTMSTIKKISDKRIPYVIASVVNKSNMASMFRLKNIVENMIGLRHWKLSYEMPFGDANSNDSLPVDEWNDFVDKMILEAHCKLLVKKLFAFSLYDNNWEKIKKLQAAGKTRCNNCGNVRNKIYVYPDFNVYPCTCLTDFCLGNLRHNKLEDILGSTAAKCFSDYDVKKSSICATCKYKTFCNGGCIGMSYHYFGELGVGDARCPMLKNYI